MEFNLLAIFVVLIVGVGVFFIGGRKRFSAGHSRNRRKSVRYSSSSRRR